ncbi:MAG: aldehyde dehydrogenase family protein, partial [Pseudomonadota bacterium]
MFINGEWKTGAKTFAVYNPATGEEIEQVADGGEAEANEAIAVAHQAFTTWAATTAYARSTILYKAYQLMVERKEELAQLMTKEQGKPLKAARNEVQYGADFLLWFAEEAKRIYGETIPSSRAEQRFIVQYQPVGVVGAVT